MPEPLTFNGVPLVYNPALFDPGKDDHGICIVSREVAESELFERLFGKLETQDGHSKSS